MSEWRSGHVAGILRTDVSNFKIQSNIFFWYMSEELGRVSLPFDDGTKVSRANSFSSRSPPVGDGQTPASPPPTASSPPLSPAATVGVARRTFPAWCWRRQGSLYPCARMGLRRFLMATVKLGRWRSSSTVWFLTWVVSGATARRWCWWPTEPTRP
jgi:hypothetical protein